MKGHLEVIAGSMFAGKTEELLRRIRRAEIAGKQTLIFKPEIDNRYGSDNIATHYGAYLDAVSIKDAISIPVAVYAQQPDIVAIDEAQFFDYNLLTIIEDLINIGKVVICSGLNQDYTGNGFGVMPQLMARADYLVHLTAVCNRCGERATKTQRIVNVSNDTIQVGGTDQYEARCRNCWDAGIL